MEQAHVPAYRLVRRPVPTAPAARLDEAQQAVVDHAAGPLLVLAGPGTGKTATIVAAVADRIERRGLDPERVLAHMVHHRLLHLIQHRHLVRPGRRADEVIGGRLPFHVVRHSSRSL